MHCSCPLSCVWCGNRVNVGHWISCPAPSRAHTEIRDPRAAARSHSAGVSKADKFTAGSCPALQVGHSQDTVSTLWSSGMFRNAIGAAEAGQTSSKELQGGLKVVLVWAPLWGSCRLPAPLGENQEPSHTAGKVCQGP